MAGQFLRHQCCEPGFDEGCETSRAAARSCRAAGRPRAELSADDRRRAHRARAIFLLWGAKAMSPFPWLTVLDRTACRRRTCCCFAWRAKQESRALAGAGLQFTRARADPASLAPLRFRLRAASISGAHAWISSLGVEYHVGIDGLGLLMLLLDVHRCPDRHAASWQIRGTRAALFLSGAPAPGMPLRHLHRAELFPLVHLLGTSLIPAFFLIKLWGGPQAHRRSHAVPGLHDGRQRRDAAVVSRDLSGDTETLTSSNLRTGAERPADARRHRQTWLAPLHAAACRARSFLPARSSVSR